MIRLLAWLVFSLIAMLIATLGTALWGYITNLRVEFGGFTTNIGIAFVTWLGAIVISGYVVTSGIVFLLIKRLSISSSLLLLFLFVIQYLGLVVLLDDVVVEVAAFGFLIGAGAVVIGSFAAKKFIAMMFGSSRLEPTHNRLGKR